MATTRHRHFTLRTLAAMVFAGAASAALAQSFPSKPIIAIYPFAAGGASEVPLRAMYAEAGKALGQSIILENRPGAGGRLGVIAVQRAPGDGYLLTFATDAVLTVVPNASPTFTVQPGKDYTPVQLTFGNSLVVVAQARLPFKDARGWIEYAKANPGKLNYSTQGVGGNQHLIMEQMLPALGISMTHIPYGASQQMTDLASGTMDMTAFTGGPLKPLVDSGRMNAIAWVSPQRNAIFPNTPTLKELGYDVALQGWTGIVAPPGTPPDIVNRINVALNTAQKLPEVARHFANSGFDPFYKSPQEFEAQIRADLESYRAVVKRLNLKFD